MLPNNLACIWDLPSRNRTLWQAMILASNCESRQGQHPDHVLAPKGECESHGYQGQRTVGFVYSKPQEQTVPLYACVNEQEHSHFASNEPNCEKLGKKERLLGYALSQ